MRMVFPGTTAFETMTDLLFIGITAGFFLLTGLYASACETL